jgi:6-phospho-3-hexuloisomerase
MNTSETAQKILLALKTSLNGLEEAQAEGLADAIIGANRIFTAGAGRSLLMIRSFAMRLMHMNFKAYVVGETVTPAIQEGDLLIIASGSGETGALTLMADKAKKIGASLALITAHPDSTIGRLADHIVSIPVIPDNTSQLGASLFEQCLLILCDALVIRIVEKCGIEQGNELLKKNHANLE